MQYDKPHLTYQAQVALMRSRGLDVGSEADAVRALKRVGYYRLSAYTYPMRATDETFKQGASLPVAVAMHDFDHRLRKTILPALQEIEIALRTKIAYTLGKHGAFAHLTGAGLDPSKCSEVPGGPDRSGTKYEVWLDEYRRQQSKAKDEDYVKHFILTYEGKVPIWAATEFMTMGTLIALYRLMNDQDAKRIAAEFGVKNQEIFFGWLKALNVLRNNCAHNARLWNRKTVYPPKKINVNMVDERLSHLSSCDSSRFYFLAALTAYLIRHVNPTTHFPQEFLTTLKKLPEAPLLLPLNRMGFPDDWRGLALWQE